MNSDIFSNRFQLRRRFFVSLLSLLAWIIAPATGAQSIDDVTLNVYKEPTCGCCEGWIAHMGENGYSSIIHHPQNIGIVKAELGLRPEWVSCHTAVNEDGYVFEGHIPEKFIDQFLAAPPAGALGLAVPGMPIGGPGMEMGDRFTPYDILLINKNGTHSVFASIKSADEQH